MKGLWELVDKMSSSLHAPHTAYFLIISKAGLCALIFCKCTFLSRVSVLCCPVLGTYPFTESGAVGAESTATKASGRATERTSLQAGSRQTTTFPSTHVVSSEHMKSFTFLWIIWSSIWTTNEFCSFVRNPSINFEKVEKTVYYLDVKTGIFVIFGHMWTKYRKCSKFEVLCSWGKGVPKSCHSATFCIMFTFVWDTCANSFVSIFWLLIIMSPISDYFIFFVFLTCLPLLLHYNYLNLHINKYILHSLCFGDRWAITKN